MKEPRDQDVKPKDICEVMVNSNAIAEITELITHPSTRCSQSVVDVIHKVEDISARHRQLPRVQQLAFTTVRALWHGWRGTVRFPGHNPCFGDIPKSVRQEFVLQAIEVGTAIAARQIEAASK